MATILIADAGKASLVMSSEVFKDKIPGAVVHVATNGKDCMAICQQHKVDLCLIDFDLPDVDGVSLILALRDFFTGPILLSAYPEKIVEEAVANDLFAFNDAGAWIRKPVQFDDLADRIEMFLVNNHRLGRRFPLRVTTQLVGKGAGRGKRAPRMVAELVNVSIGGACIKIDKLVKLKSGQEFNLALPLSGKMRDVGPKDATKSKARKGAAAARPVKPPAIKFKADEAVKAKVCWVSPDGRVGLQFGKLSDGQRKGLEVLLRQVSGPTGASSDASGDAA